MSLTEGTCKKQLSQGSPPVTVYKHGGFERENPPAVQTLNNTSQSSLSIEHPGVGIGLAQLVSKNLVVTTVVALNVDTGIPLGGDVHE